MNIPKHQHEAFLTVSRGLAWTIVVGFMAYTVFQVVRAYINYPMF